jgi:phenylalanine-4-hydroxylase
MPETKQYQSKQGDSNGVVAYSAEENQTWQLLYDRQITMLPGRVSEVYRRGLQRMNFPQQHIPQLAEVSAVLQKTTGWSVTPVPALIDFRRFFELLAQRQFPAATFIRRREDLDYLEEPDVFHELFGHTPLLTDQRFADFCQAYGQAGLQLQPADFHRLARLFWFTVEFGLHRSKEGIQAYGAGIVSSPGELVYALESNEPEYRPFTVPDVLRTPYRIDVYQSIYYVLDDWQQLFDLTTGDLQALCTQAKKLGDFAPACPEKLVA